MKTKIYILNLLFIVMFGSITKSFSQQWLTAGNSLVGGEKLGSLNAQPLNMLTNNTSRIFITPTGRVGINTQSPVNIFTLKGAGSNPVPAWVNVGAPLVVGFGEDAIGNADFVISMASNQLSARPVFVPRRSRGTLAAPIAVSSNDYLGSILSSGYDGSAFQNPAAIDFFVDGTPSAGNVPARVSLVTGSNSANRAERLKVGSTGNFDFNNGQLSLQKTTGNVSIGTGNLKFTNTLQSIEFPEAHSNVSNAMINMFSAGTSNDNRMVLAHSPLHENWGLQYRDSSDRFDFISSGESVLLVDLGVKNIGIGTKTPQRKLHVVNGSFGGGAPEANSPFVVENNTDNFISVLSPSTAQRGIYFGDNLNVHDGGIIYDGTTNAMLFRTNGNTNRMSLSSTGNVSIGGNLDIAGTTLSLGSVETLADAGANVISSNSDLIPSLDNSRRLGSSALRWSELWATDGTINTSDIREKSNIRDLNYGVREIMKLRSARFKWKNRDDEGDKIGLIAQELQKVLPEVVRDSEFRFNEETGLREKVPSSRLGVAYSDIIPVLIHGIQEQQVDLEAKDEKIKDLQLQLNNANSELNKIKDILISKGVISSADINNSANTLSKARLEQSIPNPSGGNTTLRYFLPNDAKNAAIQITAINGSVVRSYRIANSGSGYVTFNAGELPAGEYIYTLLINGSQFESKKMTIAR